MSDIIHFNQTDFLHGRYIGDNLRRVLETIEYYGLSGKPGMVLSLPDLRELFMSLFWFGQGVIWVGILCSFFYVLYFFVLAGYGSQSGTAVYRCL